MGEKGVWYRQHSITRVEKGRQVEAKGGGNRYSFNEHGKMKKILEVFWRFLLLGCISFGGPAAHIGYFQRSFVQKLQWIDAEAYARLIALCQFLPGPASSQIGFALGLRRAGLGGAFAAFAGFTLPSFLLLSFLAMTGADQQASLVFSGVTHGLKLLAVVVVADATVNMYTRFCREKSSAALAVMTGGVVLVFSGVATQMIALAIAALAGFFRPRPRNLPVDAAVEVKWFPLVLFVTLFVSLPFFAFLSPSVRLFADFYQSGSLVFGGGHVVLPLLKQMLGESISTDRFLLGYAAAQAVPGPMFSLAAFLGAELSSPGSAWLGAALATCGIFLPGFLLVLSMHGAWEILAEKPRIAGAVWGINAAVVGLLMAALYTPVFISAVRTPLEMAAVMGGVFALSRLQIPIIVLVAGFAGVGVLLH